MEIIQKNKKWIFIIVIFFALMPSLIFLISRSAKIESWDNWYSVQTMLAVRYWDRGGFWQNYGLFLPIGFHPEVKILDKPEFRFLSDGIFTGGLIGKRLYYTHYPSGFSVPFFILDKLGIENRLWFRMLAIIFSFVSIAFLAGFIYLLTDRNRWIALLAVFYYATSSNFLGYADATSTMTPDDFLRNLILFLSVFSWKSVTSDLLKKKLRVLMWVVYFFLAISSYDSIFFVFFWLCAFHIMMTRTFAWKEWIYWATAPITAFILQIAQNTWYLGWRDMFLDLFGAFVVRSGEAPAVAGSLPPVLRNVFASLSTIGYLTDIRTRFALPIIAFIAYILWRKKVFTQTMFIISALGIAGMIYGMIFPVAGTFGYQGRQMAPALLLLLMVATWESFKVVREKISVKNLVFAVLVIGIWLAHFSGMYAYAKDWPNNVFAKEKITHLQELNRITDSSTMILRTKSGVSDGDRFYEQYYADRLILTFKDIDTLLEYLDKIYSTIPGKVNFLLVLQNQDYRKIMDWFGIIGKYDAFNERISSLPEEMILVRVFHK